jgi:Protein of unknown function (DUF1640)
VLTGFGGVGRAIRSMDTRFRSSSHPMSLRAFPHLRTPLFPQLHRSFRTTATLNNFHFDTHHFVQRLEREGLNRAQAEGIMSAMAEVIDESIRNMTSNMVTKADHEKVHPPISRSVTSTTRVFTDAKVSLGWRCQPHSNTIRSRSTLHN